MTYMALKEAETLSEGLLRKVWCFSDFKSTVSKIAIKHLIKL
jgi:hypothetical protein